MAIFHKTDPLHEGFKIIQLFKQYTRTLKKI